MLEWVAISFSRGSSQPKDQTQVSRTAGRRFNPWATRAALPDTQRHCQIRALSIITWSPATACWLVPLPCGLALQQSISFLSPGRFWCSVIQLCLTLWHPMDCSTSGFSDLRYLLEFSHTHVHWVSDTIQPPQPLLPSSPFASVFLSMRIFSNESALRIRRPGYWSFSLSISPSKEYSGLISFRIDWFDLLVQGTLKTLLQHHSSKASILWCSDFFMVQLSYPYMTTGKTIALTIWTFLGKVMSLVFNVLCRFVIVFLPRNKLF